MKKNICRFTPDYPDINAIHIINYVFEAKRQSPDKQRIESLYKIHYIKSGKGYIHTEKGAFELCAGDVFFTFPSMPYRIESVNDFSYIYISFLGKGGLMLLDRLGITSGNFLFKNVRGLEGIWENGLKISENTSDLAGEGVLLYTLSVLGSGIMRGGQGSEAESTAFLRIKKYVDDNFLNPALSLESISRALHYNPKYISSVFKKNMNVGFSAYLNIRRIQHSCTMINHGHTSVSDIAMLCGYTDSHYFSKVFKEKLGVSPREYIKNA